MMSKLIKYIKIDIIINTIIVLMFTIPIFLSESELWRIAFFIAQTLFTIANIFLIVIYKYLIIKENKNDEQD